MASRGLGSPDVRSLMERAATGKPLTLRVLHANPRARALYERLGLRALEEIETHVYMRWWVTRLEPPCNSLLLGGSSP